MVASSDPSGTKVDRVIRRSASRTTTGSAGVWDELAIAGRLMGRRRGGPTCLVDERVVRVPPRDTALMSGGLMVGQL